MKDEAAWFLRKAGKALRASEMLLAAKDPETAVGRAYYCMLHTAQALLREQDIRFRKHSSVHGAFGQHFAKTALIDPKFHRWLLDSYDDRIRGDYDTECVIEEESASLRIGRRRSSSRPQGNGWRCKSESRPAVDVGPPGDRPHGPAISRSS